MLELLDREQGIDWSELLKNRLVVILGEPGSGKSTEFQLQTDKLREQLRQAFCIPLQRLVGEPLLTVLGERDGRTFEEWKNGNLNAYFFFDAVDESMFKQPNDFLTALDRINDALSDKELRRAKLFFSSRIFEWRPVTDPQALQDRFPISALTSKKISETKIDGSILEDRSNTTQVVREGVDKSIDEIVVVHLAPLNREQVRAFAQFRGLTDAEAFIQALDDNYAWEFARRPLDVDWLIDYWRVNRRFGSLTELIEHGLRHYLRETEGRESQYPLTPENAREGAEFLAAASLLCRNLNYKVPDDAFLPDTVALDSGVCLPDSWLAKERRALLDRPLFESALYGCIRFHHRRMMEYLTASWLSERLRDNCPLNRLDDLLFAEHQGEYILRPTLTSVAAWLANGDEPHNKMVRERLLQAAPSVHFNNGDPQQLPIEYKRQILDTLVARYNDGQRVKLGYSPETLSRLADPALAPDVSALLLNRGVADDLRADILSLVRHGRMMPCLETAFQILADSSENDMLRQYAAAALRDCADNPMRSRLADLVGTLSTLSSSLTGLLCETLYPDVIDADGLVKILRKAEPSQRYSGDLSWTLKHHLGEKLTPGLASPLLAVFLDLVCTAPYREDAHAEALISERFGWVCDMMPIVLNKLFINYPSINPDDMSLIAQSIRLIETYWNYHGQRDKEIVQQLQEGIKHYPQLRREYFWQGVERFRIDNQRNPDFYSQITGGRSLVTIDESDFPWLVEDARQKVSANDCAVALLFASYLWQPCHFQRSKIFAFLRTWHDRTALRELLLKYLWQRIVFPIRRFWFNNVRMKLLDRHWWWKQNHTFLRLYHKIRDQYFLHRYIYRLYSGQSSHWLVNLSQEAATEQGSARWAASDWTALRKKRGVLVAWATQHGCENSWKRHKPLLPHEKTEPNKTSSQTVVGLCGLQSLWKTGQLDFSTLTDEDAERATRYALNELNDFADWLPVLARIKPDSVRSVLRLCIQGEWSFPAEGEHTTDVLSKLSWRGERFAWLIAEDVMSQLRSGDPRHPQILEYALSILLKSTSPFRSQLIAFASQRVRDYSVDSLFYTIWLALWMQLEALSALSYLTSYISGLPSATADSVVLRLCDALRGDRFSRTPRVARLDYVGPRAMRILIPLVYRHIRAAEDIDRMAGGEAYTPTARDHAQEFRNGLLHQLAQLDDQEIPAVFKELINTSELASHREYISDLIALHISRRADLTPWSAFDIRMFTKEFEIDPRNDTELFRIACWRLEDIKHAVEKTDNSLRDEVRPEWVEPQLRSWFQRKLIDASRGRYTIPQEEEIDQQQRPDLRFENPRSAAVPVELKWAENWTAKQHLERLENQLVGQYLRAYNVRYGIYLLGYIERQQHWDHPSESRRIDFKELVRLIEQRAQELVRIRPEAEGLRVISINFSIGQFLA